MRKNILLIMLFMIAKIGYSQNIIHETEPNDTSSAANLIGYGYTIIASISPIGDVDYYTFNVSNNDTIIIFVGLINNSQLAFTYTLLGNIISWNMYADSVFAILGSGTYYLKCSSSNSNNTSELRKMDTRNNNINNSLSTPIINPRSITGTLSNNQLKITKRTIITSLNNNTGDYQIMINKYYLGKPIIDSVLTDFNTNDKSWGSIFDERWNSIRFRVYYYPNGSNTTIQWEYGQDINYSYSKACADTFDVTQECCTSIKLTDLTPNTTYHYRVHASNKIGDTYSNDYTFTTPATPDPNIIINPETFLNFNDTSYIADAGSGGYYTFDPTNLKSITFQDNFNGWVLSGEINLLHTTDGGISWKKKNDYLKGTVYSIVSVSFSDVLHGFIVSSMGWDRPIFTTSDGGNTWKQQSTISLYWYDLSWKGDFLFSDSLHGTMVGYGGIKVDYANMNQMILHTTDGGLTWKQQNGGLKGTWNTLNGVSFLDSLNGTIVGHNDGGALILHTTDGGNTWNPQNSGLNSMSLNNVLTGVSFSDIMHGTIIGYDENAKGIILHTTNGGNTWEQQNSGLNNLNPVFTDVSFSDSLNGIIVGERGCIIKTLNGGISWSQVQSGTHNDLNCVTLLKNNKFIITGVWETILRGDIVTSVNEQKNIIPTKYELSQNYPNPFNPTTNISFSLPSKSFVSLKVFDLIGREVATLINEMKSAGTYTTTFNAAKMSSGVYFYRLQAGSFIKTKKLVLLK